MVAQNILRLIYPRKPWERERREREREKERQRERERDREREREREIKSSRKILEKRDFLKEIKDFEIEV